MIMQEIFNRLALLIQVDDRASFVTALEEIDEGELNFDINFQDSATKNTLLHICTQNGSKTMTKNCLRNGAFLNVQNSRGNTPLHFCYAYGYTELGDYLVSKGADDSLRNCDGLTPYEGLSRESLDAL